MTRAPELASKRFCNLCGEPRVRSDGIWLCKHCDTTKGHTPPCGGCLLVREWRPPE